MSDPKTNEEAPEVDADSAPDYAFDGYEVAVSVKVGLTPPQLGPQAPMRSASAP